MKSRSAILAITAVGVGVVVAPAVGAGQASATPATTCTMAYLNPNVAPLPLQANSVFEASAGGNGKMTMKVRTDAVSVVGYRQHVSFTWANLDTGRNGGEQWSKRVVGPTNTVTFPGVKTGVGRITFQANVSNTSAVDAKRVTTGQCGTEMKAY
ncbi:hypothetical protein [Gordonia liuliyuniae]|uniref:Uncharacterized protein n=1 Tax=Gordonia liuliyuniae TaxID=2911517 RepID=A0ABS9ISG7_9ACTN|nr:hypothetical protein [Gordonia liuliyuniae]MCF8588460.1 hypothetical protein [Gordonia liuliyuniae]